MAANTREKILETALEMFAEKGYSGTNIRELSEALGLSKAAMYRHFRSKEDLWDKLTDSLTRYYDMNLGQNTNVHIPASGKELIDQTLKMVDFTIHDRKIVLIRKVITSEQFRQDKIKALADEYFVNRTEKIYTAIFDGMMKNNSLKKDNPEILAFSFTAPITTMIHMCDREPEKENEILDKIREFAEHFINIYGQ